MHFPLRTELNSEPGWRSSTLPIRIPPRWTLTASAWIKSSTRRSTCLAVTITRRPSRTNEAPTSGSGSVLSTTESLSSSVQTLTVGLTEIINPRISNEVRANYSNDRVGNKYALDNFGGAVPLPDSLCFPPDFRPRTVSSQFLIAGAGEFAQGKYSTTSNARSISSTIYP